MIFFGRIFEVHSLVQFFSPSARRTSPSPAKVGFSGIETHPRRFRESYRLSVVDRGVRIGLRLLTASVGVAMTQCGFRHSIHRSLALIRGQIVLYAWGKTG
jgi:hypothetical protein